MRPTMLRLSALVTALIVVSGGALALSASSEEKRKPKSFKVLATTEHNNLIDLGTDGLSQGDHLIILKRMALKKRPSKSIGEDWISCFITAVEGETNVATSCTVNYSFDGLGQITAQGSVRLDLASQRTFDIAITGGTGKFKRVGGFVTIKQTTGAHHLTFHLDRVVPRALR